MPGNRRTSRQFSAAARKRNGPRNPSKHAPWSTEVLAAARAFRSIVAVERATTPHGRRSAAISRAVRTYYLG